MKPQKFLQFPFFAIPIMQKRKTRIFFIIPNIRSECTLYFCMKKDETQRVSPWIDLFLWFVLPGRSVQTCLKQSL